MSDLKNYFDAYLKALKKELGDYEIPKLIMELVAFDIKMQGKYYHERFVLRKDEDVIRYLLEANGVKEHAIKKISEKLVVFADADVSGGVYAFWLAECQKAEDAPIVWLSSEGDQEVVASNIEAFVILLTTGKEYFRLDDEDLNDYVTELPAFRKWVKEHLKLNPLTQDEEREHIQNHAKETYQRPFNNWLRNNGAGYLVG